MPFSGHVQSTAQVEFSGHVSLTVKNVLLVQGTESGIVANLEEWVELANGCLCCSVKSDLLNALETLIERRSAVDYILIETTGRTGGGLRLVWDFCYQVIV